MNIQIVPLNKNTYEEAVRIAVEGNTGKEKDIRQRLKKYKQYFIALDNSRVLGEIGWYQDDGSFAGKSLGNTFPYGKNVYWLSHFAVDRNHRNLGVGKLLLHHIEAVVKEKKGNQLWVYTSQAAPYYKKNGFMFVQKALILGSWEEVLMKRL